MAYQLSGTYISSCNCSSICPCPMGEAPTAPEGMCYAMLAFRIETGTLDGTDLAGVNFAVLAQIPNRLTEGNLTGGIVVDEAASDEQASAIERIMTGREGGEWAEFAPMFTTFHPLERARITFSDGEAPSVSIGSGTEIEFEPFRGSDGSPTKVENAMFGFGAPYAVGKGSGRLEVFGQRYDPSHGESGPFELA
jgi:hypothetical protein